MEISINHPTNRPNFTAVTLGDLTIWFSYRTPVGYMLPGEGRVVRENEWGPTTGRHLNEIDRGDKASRLPGYVFRGRLAAHLASIGQTVETREVQHAAETCPGRPCSTDCDHVETVAR